MNKKLILLILSFMFAGQQVKSSGLSTTIALGAGIAATYFSAPLFYANPNGVPLLREIFGTENTRVAKDEVRKAIWDLKRMFQRDALPPVGDETKNYIDGARGLLGFLTFAIIKAIY